jgi:AbrB family looped-hinge helix DNA binding protein
MIEVTKMTSRGQVVIPQSVRENLNLKEGEKMVVIEEGGNIILRPLSRIEAKIEDEILDMKMAARAWKDIEKGKFKKKSADEFLAELDKW